MQIEGASETLPWNTRMKIALGAAEGLKFLHSQYIQIILRYFKTNNVFLDANYDAKISDSKHNRTGVPTNAVVRKYVAPEYITTGHATAKSDVYGFGVVLLELLSGKRAWNTNRPLHQMDLVNWARPYLEKGWPLIRRIVDSSLGLDYSLPGAEKAAKLAYRCLSGDPRRRPSMDEVVEVLEQLQDAKKTEKKTSLSYGSKGKTRGERSSASKNKGISQWLKGSRLKQQGGMDSKPAPTTGSLS